MLKVKRGFDIKDLVDYGFELYSDNITEFYRIKLKTEGHDAYLIIKPLSKQIIIDTGSTCIQECDALYDLIQDGLVEKVVE